MARGLSQAMAPNTSARDSAGSSSRTRRADRRRAISAGLPEGGVDLLFLGDLLARQLGDDGAVAEHIDAVAMHQFIGLGRVPEEGAPRARLAADQVINLLAGGDVDAPSGIVQQDNGGLRRQG